jgi:hypothetical protein
MSSKDKARLLGLLMWLYTGFNVLLVAVIAVIYVSLFGFIFSQAPRKANEPDPAIIMLILIIAFAVALVFTILFSIPKLVAGYGLRNEKNWARTWAIVASIMACMSFPFGTAIGVFGLVFLFSDEGKLYFDQVARNGGQLAGVASPTVSQPNSWQ